VESLSSLSQTHLFCFRFGLVQTKMGMDVVEELKGLEDIPLDVMISPSKVAYDIIMYIKDEGNKEKVSREI
jgi:hypothetical protein